VNPTRTIAAAEGAQAVKFRLGRRMAARMISCLAHRGAVLTEKLAEPAPMQLTKRRAHKDLFSRRQCAVPAGQGPRIGTAALQGRPGIASAARQGDFSRAGDRRTLGQDRQKPGDLMLRSLVDYFHAASFPSARIA